MNKFAPVAKKDDIVVQELNDEVLIYDLSNDKAFCLNETSAIIWHLCDGTKTVSEISQSTAKKLNSNISEDFVWLALEQFKMDKLISNEFEFKEVCHGLSRREVIRKVGFASLVALPVVALIVAPIPANAASTVCQCVTPGDCFSQSSCPNDRNCNGSGQCAP